MSKSLEQSLLDGDFSAIEAAFVSDSHGQSGISKVIDDPTTSQEVIEEALTCASFLGANPIVRLLIDRQVNPQGGNRTGSDALHWAANRGNLETVQILLSNGASFNTINRFGGTVLEATIWSAMNEPHPNHLQIIRELLKAGANLQTEYPQTSRDIRAIFEEFEK